VKAKSFILLVLVLAVLGGLAVWRQKQDATHRQAAREAPVERMLDPALLNDVARFTLASGTNSVALARKENGWVVETLFNYPAVFEKVAGRLRQIADVKGGEVIRGGTERLAEFGLTPTATNEAGGRCAVLTLEDAAGKVMRTITIGFTREPKSMEPLGAMPGASYIRIDDGPVQLVPVNFASIPSAGGDWIDRALLAIPFTNIADVAVTLTNGTSYRVQSKEDGTLVLDGLGAQEQTRQETARGLFSALQNLALMSVENPSLGNDVSGLDHPDVYVAKSREGITYTVKTGLHAPDYGRYAKIDTPELAPWIFVLNESDAQTMLMPRDQLVTNIVPAEAMADPAATAPTASPETTPASAPGSEPPTPAN
jgi:hypothetical protein